MAIGNILVALLLFGTLAALIAGVVLMSIGGNANRKYGNRLMTMRVTLQGLALLVLILIFAASGK